MADMELLAKIAQWDGEELDLPEAELEDERMATLSLNIRLMPMARGEFFEDRLDYYLRVKGIGYVDGGGTMLSEQGEPIASDIGLTIANTPEARAELLSVAQALKLTKGSKLTFLAPFDDEGEPLTDEDDEEYEVGELEGLAVYLNGTDLPDQVYAEVDINDVIDGLQELCMQACRDVVPWSYWQGPTETALYFYGPSFQAMQAAIEPFLQGNPLCAKCRVAQIA